MTLMRYQRRGPPEPKRVRDQLRRAMTERRKIRDAILYGDDEKLERAEEITREVDRLWGQFCTEAGLAEEGRTDGT